MVRIMKNPTSTGEIEQYTGIQDLLKDTQNWLLWLHDTSRIQKDENNFKANLTRLELAGMWDKIINSISYVCIFNSMLLCSIITLAM